jgi:hypothetical protein
MPTLGVLRVGVLLGRRGGGCRRGPDPPMMKDCPCRRAKAMASGWVLLILPATFSVSHQYSQVR